MIGQPHKSPSIPPKVFWVLLFGAFFLFGAPAKADVGPPPIYSQGGILQTDAEATSVSMVAEDVTLKYGQPEGENSWDMVMPVHVTAHFTMRNTGTEDETLQVFFPSDDSAFIGGWEGDYAVISNFTVNGQSIDASELGSVGAMINGESKSINAYQWTERFPAGEDTEISISYDGASGKDYEVYYLTYVLGTGRGWKGPIGAGTITFELPDALASYSVVQEAPLQTENEFPFSVSGSAITITFENYEPDPDTTIILGVYDFDLVEQSEHLMSLPKNFQNTLSLAGVLRQLSGGPHCYFCTGEAATMAPAYYMDALDLANSESELDQVLVSFMYGDEQFRNDWTPPAIEDIKDAFSFPDCEQDDSACRYYTYVDRGGFGSTPFGFNLLSKGLKHEDFLSEYSAKIRSYDSAVADSIDSFIQGATDAYAWYANENGLTVNESEANNVESAVKDDTNANGNININSNSNTLSVSEKVTTTDSEDNDFSRWYLLGLGCVVFALALGYLKIKGKV